MKRNILLTLSLLVALLLQATVEKSVNSRFIQSPAMVTIATPAGYDPAGTQTYPTVYLLNGYRGDYKSWATIANLDSLATATRCIIVCPDGRNSWYFDSPVNPSMQMESYITRELVPWVDANYRTRPNARSRAIAGLSMGGHGALWLAMRHPDLFATAGSTSGVVDLRPYAKRWKIAEALGPKESNPKRWDDCSVITQAAKLKPGQLNIFFDCGTEDMLYKINCNLDRLLTRKGVKHIFRKSRGNHNPAYWRRAINPQMAYFKTIFYPAQKYPPL